MKKLERPCPICSSSEGEVLHTQHFSLPDVSALPDRYDVVVCPVCGFGFADVSIAQNAYSDFYARQSKYEEESTFEKESGALDLERLREQTRTISRFLRNSNDSILDIGCARGELLAEIRAIGFGNVVGLDPSPNCVRSANELGVTTFEGNLFDTSVLNGRLPFHMVVLSHVLEHVRDLNRVPREIVRLLDDSGRCYIEVPDASAYGRHPIVPYYFFDGEHINHFDEICLDNLFLPAGFKRIENGKKTIRLPEHDYPACWSVYQRAKTQSDNAIQRNENIERGIREHLDWSRNHIVDSFLAEIADSGRSVVVWGAGQMSMRLLATTALGRCNIHFFVDKDRVKQGMSLNGVPVRAPDSLDSFAGEILVVSAQYSGEIVSEIRSRGFNNPIVDVAKRLKEKS